MATTRQAAKGGEVGANGEFYEGGRFINTILENAKRHGSAPKAKNRKVQIEPGVWVMSDGRRPLFAIVGTGACYIDRYDTAKGIAPFGPAFEMHGDRMYNGTTLAEVQAKCDRYNAGERWV